MHCVNRIKCCGWIDDVTFLYHAGSLLPLMLMMMMQVDEGVDEIHTPANKLYEDIVSVDNSIT